MKLTPETLVVHALIKRFRRGSGFDRLKRNGAMKNPHLFAVDLLCNKWGFYVWFFMKRYSSRDGFSSSVLTRLRNCAAGAPSTMR